MIAASTARSKLAHWAEWFLAADSASDFFPMPRQPFWPLFQKSPTHEILFGPSTIGQRPVLESLIGNCLLAWPTAEAEMGLLLGQLLGTPSAAAVAVFQVLRRATGQREAIAAAAQKAIEAPHEQELIVAALGAHKSIESDRNALAHGHFGIYEPFPDVILWMTTETYVEYKAKVHLARVILTANQKKEFISQIAFYRQSDLEASFQGIKDAGLMWSDVITWLRSFQPQRDELYRRLCNQSRIAEALERLRQKNTLPTPP